MSIIGTSTNYKKIEDPVKRYNHFSWVTGNIDWYREDSELTYEWPTDSDGYSGAVINPESLAGKWACIFHGNVTPYGKPHGVYKEVWQLAGSKVTVP